MLPCHPHSKLQAGSALFIYTPSKQRDRDRGVNASDYEAGKMAKAPLSAVVSQDPGNLHAVKARVCKALKG